MQRIVIVGPTGAGKTSLAEQLVDRRHLPAVDLDVLFWGPNWQPVGKACFRARVDGVTAQERWIVGGNYSVARDLIWPRADTFLWLLRSHPRQRREYPRLLAQPEHRHLQVLRFSGPRAVQRWVEEAEPDVR